MTKTADEQKEYLRKWREAHPGYFKEYNRRRKLGLPPPLSDSRRMYRGQPVLTPEQRDERRRVAARIRTQRRDARHQTRVLLAKAGACEDCGVRYPPYVMQFDHVRGTKMREIAKGASLTERQFQDELAKCDLVCANCHARRTWQRRHMFGPFPLDT